MMILILISSFCILAKSCPYIELFHIHILQYYFVSRYDYNVQKVLKSKVYKENLPKKIICTKLTEPKNYEKKTEKLLEASGLRALVSAPVSLISQTILFF
jgi:hypothetical protein